MYKHLYASYSGHSSDLHLRFPKKEASKERFASKLPNATQSNLSAAYCGQQNFPVKNNVQAWDPQLFMVKDYVCRFRVQMPN